MTDDEERARALLRAVTREPALAPDPYGRLMTRIRRRHRVQVAAGSGLAVAGVAAAAIVPAQMSGHGGRHEPVGPPPAVRSAQPTMGDGEPPSPDVSMTAATDRPSSVRPVVPSISAPSLASRSPDVVVTQTDAVRHFMETDQAFGRAAVPGPGQRMYCAVTIVGQSDDSRDLYAYMLCERFSNRAGQAVLESGVSAPTLLHVQGAGPDTKVLSWELPGDGSLYAPSVEKMFPRNIAGKMLRPTPDIKPDDSELAVRAQADVDTGLF